MYTRFDNPEAIWAKSHAFFESSSTDNQALNKSNLSAMLTRDEEWVQRYVFGKRTQGAGAIHRISPLSILLVDQEWIKKNLLQKAVLSRVLDHGSTSPTCCLWWATIKGMHICYREYYAPDRVISYHRKAIAELSAGEYYSQNYADPSIFHREMEKYGGFWTVADEYRDENVYHLTPGDAPPIYFNPADNNEFATRNRINEMLSVTPGQFHPVTHESPAPQIYYCKKWEGNPYGADFAIAQLAAQKKLLLDTINGKPVYSDERDDKVADHAYDPTRYHVSMHLGMPKDFRPQPKATSFLGVVRRIKAMKQLGLIQ
jgi:hypothetical protein